MQKYLLDIFIRIKFDNRTDFNQIKRTFLKELDRIDPRPNSLKWGDERDADAYLTILYEFESMNSFEAEVVGDKLLSKTIDPFVESLKYASMQSYRVVEYN